MKVVTFLSLLSFLVFTQNIIFAQETETLEAMGLAIDFPKGGENIYITKGKLEWMIFPKDNLAATSINCKKVSKFEGAKFEGIYEMVPSACTKDSKKSFLAAFFAGNGVKKTKLDGGITLRIKDGADIGWIRLFTIETPKGKFAGYIEGYSESHIDYAKTILQSIRLAN
ncbi:MAG: hypothetical protein MK212_06300 [Saprospiraceae bacterium]|nr:hypothetical protein [Saprospiraceae bacterium]